MELLSFTYLSIDLGLIGLLIWGCINVWWVIFIGLPTFFFYPLIYEPFLKFIYTAFEMCFPGKQTHYKVHDEFESYSSLVYSDTYNLHVLGIEKSHPFEACKYEKVMRKIGEQAADLGLLPYCRAKSPDYAFLYTRIGLKHLIKLNYSVYMSKIVEIPICWMPSVILRILALRRFLYAVQGTFQAACLALDRQVGINIGGGFHHAHAHGGSGFCFYNDIGLAIEHLWKFHSDKVKKVLIVDLDAHQGNGHERDKANLYLKYGLGPLIPEKTSDQKLTENSSNLVKEGKRQIFIVDVYNPSIFPRDCEAKQHIDIGVEVTSYDSDASYLEKVEAALRKSKKHFQPDFIIYNAGTDILKGDRLGNLNVSPQGIINRDELLFQFAFENKTPILMLLSGGYQLSNGPLIGQSIVNLAKKFPFTAFMQQKNR